MGFKGRCHGGGRVSEWLSWSMYFAKIGPGSASVRESEGFSGPGVCRSMKFTIVLWWMRK